MQHIKSSDMKDLFDLGQQIMDDTRNKNFKNGFIIYLNNGKFHMASSFDSPHEIKPTIKNLMSKIDNYLNTILSISR